MSDTKLYSCGVPLIFFSLTSHPYNLKFCYSDFWVALLKNSFNALYSYTCVCSSGESCMQPSADAFFSVCKQTTGSLYFWAAHLAGPVWGPLASWCCAWLEAIGLIAGIGTQVRSAPLFIADLVICSRSFLAILLCSGAWFPFDPYFETTETSPFYYSCSTYIFNHTACHASS